MADSPAPGTIEVRCPHCGDLQTHPRKVVEGLTHRDQGGQLQNRMMSGGHNRMVGGGSPTSPINRLFTCVKCGRRFGAEVPPTWR